MLFGVFSNCFFHYKYNNNYLETVTSLIQKVLVFFNNLKHNRQHNLLQINETVNVNI